MPETKLHITLLDYTKDALSIIYASARQCYSPKFAGDLIEDGKKDVKKQAEFVKQVVASGHVSTIEHVKFTFAIEGVSRALTHQLVRHRVASYSQQSQRYVKESDFDYIIPPSIAKDPEMKKEYLDALSKIQESYNKLMKMFEAKSSKGESVNQDVRFLLPQGAETKIVVTMNCRELLHFFKERCCTRAQWEIRALANEMLKICSEKLPEIFSDSGAKCVELGYCPEGEKFTCKRYPLKSTILSKR